MSDNSNIIDPAACKNFDDSKPNLGIIQSRGLGDLFIALPIAWEYYPEYNIVWPICEQFLDTMTACAPWVKWIPVGADPRGKALFAPSEEQKGNPEIEQLIRERSDVKLAEKFYAGDK